MKKQSWPLSTERLLVFETMDDDVNGLAILTIRASDGVEDF